MSEATSAQLLNNKQQKAGEDINETIQLETININETAGDVQTDYAEISINEKEVDKSGDNTANPLPLSRTRSLSNILNRSTAIIFIKNHGGKMIGKKNPDESGRGHDWTNWCVGLSCCCFLMPSFTILVFSMWNIVRMCIIFDLIYFMIVALCSFLSDYVYCYVKEKPLDFTTIDQWTATGGVLTVIIGIIINPYPILLRTFNFITLFIALYFIGKSRKAQNKFYWRKWHCIWHLWSGIWLSYLYFQEYLLHKGFITNNMLWPFQ